MNGSDGRVLRVWQLCCGRSGCVGGPGLFIPVPGDGLGVSPLQGIWLCAAAAQELEPF